MVDEHLVATRSRRRWVTILALIVAAIAAATMVLFWMYPSWKSTKGFEVPKITQAHVDDEPFARIELGPGQTYRPIDLLAGSDVDSFCEVVSATNRPSFEMTAFGQKLESKDCRFKFHVPEEVGRSDYVVYKYRDGDVTDPTDVLQVPVIIAEAGERIEFQGIEDAAHHPADAVSAPDKIHVYVRTITTLPDPKDFVALFFLADPYQRVPVLQILPVKTGDAKAKPIAGQVTLFRSYGEKFQGYAYWTPQPLVIGGADQDRKVTDVYVGVFPKKALAELVDKFIAIDVGEDSVSVKPLLRDIEQLRAMTVGGRLLSPPLHVVRGPATTEAGGNIAPKSGE